MIITIDGTAGSGKSTTAKGVAKRLGFKYIDTGATYRTVALLAIKKGLRTEKEIVDLSKNIKINFDFVDGINHTYVNGKDITDEIRAEEVGKFASLISTYKGVRESLVKLQRELGRDSNVVCEGRDIGIVVFPDAEVKIYMTALLSERAKRREKEIEVAHLCIGRKEAIRRVRRPDATKIKKNLEARDLQDKTREHSPLKVPEGAFIIDTTNMSIEEEINKVIEIIEMTKSE